MSELPTFTDKEDDKDGDNKKPDNYANKLNLPGHETIIPEDLKPILENLPESTVKELLIALSIKKSWTGPLPPPDSLQDYNSVIANGAERIFQRSEKQSDHRMELEKLAISTELRQSGRGQHYGLIIALAFFIGAVFLAYTGHDTTGLVLGTVDILGLVSIFVYGKNEQKQNLDEKK